MRIDEERHGLVVVLVPGGDMDLTTLGAFEQRVDALLDEGVRALLWDLHGVKVLPSAAIGFLIQAARRLKDRKGRMAVCRAGRLARSTLATMGVLDVFPVFDSREDALVDLAANA